jgi:hypothetical protein
MKIFGPGAHFLKLKSTVGVEYTKSTAPSRVIFYSNLMDLRAEEK